MATERAPSARSQSSWPSQLMMAAALASAIAAVASAYAAITALQYSNEMLRLTAKQTSATYDANLYARQASALATLEATLFQLDTLTSEAGSLLREDSNGNVNIGDYQMTIGRKADQYADVAIQILRDTAGLRSFMPSKIRQPVAKAVGFGAEFVDIVHEFVKAPATMDSVKKFQNRVASLNQSIDDWKGDVVGCLDFFLANGQPVTADNIGRCTISNQYFTK